MIKDVGSRYKNTLFFGAITALMCDDDSIINGVLSKHFAKKSQELIDTNVALAKQDISNIDIEEQLDLFE